MLLSERIAQDRITLDWIHTGPPEGEHNAPEGMQWHEVILFIPEDESTREFTIPFGIMNGTDPELNDVMSSVTLGVRSVYHNGTFAGWADDWGFDPFDEDVETRYYRWRDIMTSLITFLGMERFTAYMDDTEDDI